MRYHKLMVHRVHIVANYERFPFVLQQHTGIIIKLSVSTDGVKKSMIALPRLRHGVADPVIAATHVRALPARHCVLF